MTWDIVQAPVQGPTAVLGHHTLLGMKGEKAGTQGS